ncbi:MAG TPA: hypothetical protein VGI73_04080 [Solirubrobacterales bacterium]
MTTLLLGTPDAVVRMQIDGDAGRPDGLLEVPGVTSLAVDPHNGELAYAATNGNGLHRTTDCGRTWSRGGEGIDRPIQSCVAVSRSHRNGDTGAVFVGTEMAALYRSEDGGATFTELSALQDVPSKPTWSFPPKPNTNHIVSLDTDPEDPERVYVGVELGGIIRTEDGGETFLDATAIQDLDPHQIRTHPKAPGRVYEGGGSSYCESRDHGSSWTRDIEAMPDEIRYFFTLALDPGDPETMVISSARDPFTGHKAVPGAVAWSTVYRRTADRDWHELTSANGLPQQEETLMAILDTDERTPGEFWYATDPAVVYRSSNSGESWEQIRLEWPDGVEEKITCMAISAV